MADRRVFPTPWTILESAERRLGGDGIDGPVNVLQGRGDGLAVLVGDEVEALPQQVNDAGLNCRLGESGIDRVGEALEAIDDGDENILDTAVPQFVGLSGILCVRPC